MREVEIARMRIEALLVERQAEVGRQLTVEQIDVYACEDGETAMAYTYVQGSDDPIAVAFGYDCERLDRQELERALWPRLAARWMN